MALKAILTPDEHAAIAEPLRGEYVERDGKFYADIVPVDGYALEDVSGLKSTLGKKQTQLDQIQRDMSKYKDIDPDKVRAALAELEELKKIDPTTEADKLVNSKLEAAKAQILKKHAEEIEGVQSKAEKYRAKIDKLLRDSVAVAAIAEHKGAVKLLLPHVRNSTRVVEDGDDFRVEVIDSEGNVRIGDSKGSPMSIADLVVEMRDSEEFGRAFDGEGRTGTGKGPGNGKGGAPSGLKRSQMTPEQKREYQQKHGQEAFLRLPG